MKLKLFDIYCLPNYSDFFESCIDSKIGRLHKDEFTQHQWIFLAVDAVPLFPHGVKVTYRKYSSNRVVIIQKKPQLSCTTHIGKLTGLEPSVVESREYPDETTYVDREVEGFYFLRSVPGLKSIVDILPPKPFDDDTFLENQKVLKAIQTHVGFEKGVAAEWTYFFDRFCPRERKTIASYSKRVPYVVPLSIYFVEGNTYCPEWATLPAVTSYSIFPRRTVMALPTVSSGFIERQRYMEPYMVVAEDELDTDVYATRYTSIFWPLEKMRLSVMVKPALESLMRRKMRSSGKGIGYSTLNKEQLVEYIGELNRDFVCNRFGLLHPEGHNLVERLLRIPMDSVTVVVQLFSIQYDDQIGKLSLIGAGMRSHPGVTANFFAAMASAGVNIEMISTSEIRISIVCRQADIERAVQAAHTAFDLDADQIEAVVYGGSGI